MVEMADDLHLAIATLSDLAGRGDLAIGEAGHLAAVVNETTKALQRPDQDISLQQPLQRLGSLIPAR